MVTFAEAQAAEKSIQDQIIAQRERLRTATNPNERIKAIRTTAVLAKQLEVARRERQLAKLAEQGTPPEQIERFARSSQANIRAGLGQEQLARQVRGQSEAQARQASVQREFGVRQAQARQEAQQAPRLQGEGIQFQEGVATEISPGFAGKLGEVTPEQFQDRPQGIGFESVEQETQTSGGPLSPQAQALFGFREGKGFGGTLFPEVLSPIPGAQTIVSPGFAQKLSELAPQGEQPEFVKRFAERERILSKPVALGQFKAGEISLKDTSSTETGAFKIVSSLNPFATVDIREARKQLVIPERKKERLLKAQEQVRQEGVKRGFFSLGTKLREVSGLDRAGLARIQGKEVLESKVLKLVSPSKVVKGVGSSERFVFQSVRKTAPVRSFVSGFAAGAGKLIISPVVSATRGGIAGTREAFKTLPGFKPLPEESAPFVEKKLGRFGTEDVVTLGITGAFLVAPPLVAQAGAVGLGGFQLFRTVKEPTPERFGELAVLGTAGAFAGVSLFGQGKLFLTGQKVPKEEVFAESVLAGREQFPKTRNIPAALKSFEKAREASTKQVITAHTTSIFTFKPGPIKTGPEALKGLEDPGLFVTPRGQASPFFLRLGGELPEAQQPVRFEIIPKLTGPKVVEIPVREVRRQPRKVLLQPGFKATSEFLETQAGKGIAFISKRSEAGFSPEFRKGLPSTTRELEAVIPVGTELFKVSEPRPRFTVLRGQVIPIERFKITGKRVSAKEFSKTSEKIGKASKELKVLFEGERVIRPAGVRGIVFAEREVGEGLRGLRETTRGVRERVEFLRPSEQRVTRERVETLRSEVLRPESARPRDVRLREEVLRPQPLRPSTVRGRGIRLTPERLVPPPEKGLLDGGFSDKGRRKKKSGGPETKFKASLGALTGFTKGIRPTKKRLTGFEQRGVPVVRGKKGKSKRLKSVFRKSKPLFKKRRQ